MHRSRDGGRSWEEINRGLTYKNVWAIAQHPTTGALFVGTSPADVFVSTATAAITGPSARGWDGCPPPGAGTARRRRTSAA